MRRYLFYHLLLVVAWLASPAAALEEILRSQPDASHYSPKKAVLVVELGEKSPAGTKLGDAIQQARRELNTVELMSVADMASLSTKLDERPQGSVGLVVLIHPQDEDAIQKLPGLYPDMLFTFIDAVTPSYALNAQNVQFREEEGAFLLGAIAAIHTPARIAVMAMEETARAKLMRTHFEEGVEHIRPDADLVAAMNVRPSATNHTRLSTTITSAYQEGAAIIFSSDDDIVEQALRVARQERQLVLSGNAPTHSMDTSRLMTYMVKRYDLALLDVVHIYQHKQWHPGIIPLGVSGGYVDYALNSDNVEIFPKDSIDQIEAIKDYIGQGIYDKKE